MVASAEETESSASSISSGRHSADLPIVGPPRGLLARVSQEENPFQFFFLSLSLIIMYMLYLNIFDNLIYIRLYFYFYL
jgi:hypothetical protein